VRGDRRVIEQAVRLVVGAEQCLDPGTQAGVAIAGSLKIGGSNHRVGHLARGGENISFAHDTSSQPETISITNARAVAESRKKFGEFFYDGQV
jgi:hypothetical protein